MLVYQVSLGNLCSQLQNLPLRYSVKYLSIGNDTLSIICLCTHIYNYVEVKKQKGSRVNKEGCKGREVKN